MSQIKLFILVFLSLALIYVFGAQNNQPFMIASFAAFVIFFGWLCAIRKRDSHILEEAKKEREAAAQVITSPPQTSKGTHGIFVPSPLQDRVEE